MAGRSLAILSTYYVTCPSKPREAQCSNTQWRGKLPICYVAHSPRRLGPILSLHVLLEPSFWQCQLITSLWFFHIKMQSHTKLKGTQKSLLSNVDVYLNITAVSQTTPTCTTAARTVVQRYSLWTREGTCMSILIRLHLGRFWWSQVR